MAIILRLDRMMADRKISLNELAARVGISNVNLSNIKTGKISAVRFSTLNAICAALQCQPGDILEYQPDKKLDADSSTADLIPTGEREPVKTAGINPVGMEAL